MCSTITKKKKASHIWTIWGNNNLSDSLFKRTPVSIRIKRRYLTREKGKIILFLFLLHFPSPVNKTFSLIPTLPFSAQRTLRTIQYRESWKETYYSMPFFFPGHLKADYSAFQNIPNTFFFCLLQPRMFTKSFKNKTSPNHWAKYLTTKQSNYNQIFTSRFSS